MQFSRPVGYAALLALAAGSLTLVATPAVAASPDLVISQVYGGGGNTGATYTHDYVEVFNRGTTSVSTKDKSVQYAAAAGSYNVAFALGDVMVPAGGSLLVRLASGGAAGAAVPEPSAVTGTTNMSATAGRVILADSTTALACGATGTTAVPCTADQLGRIVDLVGYGPTANAFEGAGPAPAGSNTAAVVRGAVGAVGCTDTDQNSTDFAARAGAPRTSATAPAPCGTTTPPPDPEPEPEPQPGPQHGTISTISSVQGSGQSSPVVGQRITVDAVVTATTTSNDAVTGFFVQEQDADRDTSADTSEGLEVLCGTACPPNLRARDLVTVTGVVGESFATTRLDASGADALSTVRATGQARPTPATISLPASAPLTTSSLFESVEGMLTTVTTPLVVTEFFKLARFGELVLAPSRAYQHTHTSAPSTAGYQAHMATLAASQLVLDDDSGDQNDATSGPDSNEPYPYPSGGLAVDNRFRGGDTITDLTGVLQYGFGKWRMRPAATERYVFTPTNPRTAAPEPVSGTLKVASFNVLNSFKTIDTTSSGSSGPCGPSRTLDCRGADSEAELERQRAKIVAALTAMDPDVAGLIEIQNDADVTLAHLVEGLNAATAPGTYDYVRTGTIGTDAIKLAFVYKPATVELVGGHAVLDSTVDPRFEDTRSRPALAQTFLEKATGQKVTVSVNHFKSKGSACTGDPDRGDGAGNCDLTRTRAAQALGDWLKTDPTGSGDPDVLVIGDLNSYKREAPITALEEAGFSDLIERFGGEKAYGYLFDGQLGYLDHALTSASLVAQVTGANEWHINADEPQLLDYNDTVKDVGETDFERESSARALYAPDPYRSSDHDPVVVGLALAQPNRAPVASAGGPYAVDTTRTVQLDASASTDADGDVLTYAWDLDADGAFDDATGATPTFTAGSTPGTVTVSVRVTDGTASSTAGASVVVSQLNRAPVADAGGPYAVAPTRTVVLDASRSSDADRDVLTYSWDLDGDGAFGDASGPKPTYRAGTAVGRFPVAVQVSDGTATAMATTYVDVPGAKGGKPGGPRP